MPSQSLLPGGQVNPQCPIVQVAVPLVPAGQTLPQPPQFNGSVMVSTHRVPQIVAAEAGHEHIPCWHVWPPPHCRPHPPQFMLSELTSTHVVPHMRDVSSICPLQSSSIALQGRSVVALGVQSQAVPRPGSDTHAQLEDAGQSVRAMQVREQ